MAERGLKEGVLIRDRVCKSCRNEQGMSVQEVKQKLFGLLNHGITENDELEVD